MTLRGAALNLGVSMNPFALPRLAGLAALFAAVACSDPNNLPDAQIDTVVEYLKTLQ